MKKKIFGISIIIFFILSVFGWEHIKGSIGGNYFTKEKNKTAGKLSNYKQVFDISNLEFYDIRTGYYFNEEERVIFAINNNSIRIYDSNGVNVKTYYPLKEPEIANIQNLSLNTYFDVGDLNGDDLCELVVNVSQNTPGGKNYLIIYSSKNTKHIISLPPSERASFLIVPFEDDSQILAVGLSDPIENSENNGIYYYDGEGELINSIKFGDGIIIESAGTGPDYKTWIAAYNIQSGINLPTINGVNSSNIYAIFVDEEMNYHAIPITSVHQDVYDISIFWILDNNYNSPKTAIEFLSHNYDTRGIYFLNYDWTISETKLPIEEDSPLSAYSVNWETDGMKDYFIYFDESSKINLCNSSSFSIQKQITVQSPPNYIITTNIENFSSSENEYLVVYRNHLDLFSENLSLKDSLEVPFNISKCFPSDIDNDKQLELIFLDKTGTLRVFKDYNFYPQYYNLYTLKNLSEFTSLSLLKCENSYLNLVEIFSKNKNISNIRISPWGEKFLFTENNFAFIFDTEDRSFNTYSLPHNITTADWITNSDTIIYYTTYEDGNSTANLYRYNLITKEEVLIKSNLHSKKIVSIRISYDNHYIAFLDEDRTLFTYDFQNSQVTQIDTNVEKFKWFFFKYTLYLTYLKYNDTFKLYNYNFTSSTEIYSTSETVNDFAPVPASPEIILSVNTPNNPDSIIKFYVFNKDKQELHFQKEIHSHYHISNLEIGLNDFYPILKKAIYVDNNGNSEVDAGDTIKLIFNREITTSSEFESDMLPYLINGSAGINASISLNSAKPNELIITLGSNPSINVDGIYIPEAGGTSSTGVQISTQLANTLVDRKSQTFHPLSLCDGLLFSTYVDITYFFKPTTFYVSQLDSENEVCFSSDDALFKKGGIYFPPQSLLSPANIKLEPLTDEKYNNGFKLIYDVLDINPTNPPILEVPYSLSDINREKGYLEEGLRVHYFDTNSQQWRLYNPDAEFEIDKANKVVKIPMDPNFSTRDITLKDSQPNLYANIGLATVEDASSFASPKTPNVKDAPDFVLTVGSNAIYTKHKLRLPDYTNSTSGIEVKLQQVSFAEKHDFPTNALLKVIVSEEPTGLKYLTMEYKDDNDPLYQSDCNGASEDTMRIYRYNENTAEWELVPGTQTVDTSENTVTVEISDSLYDYQIYGVKPMETYINCWEIYK